MLRLFVGIPLPPERKLALSTICRGVRGIRWADPGNYHVTLQFIGEVDEGKAYEIGEALGEIRARKFDLAIARVDIFGPPNKPRHVYAGLDPQPALHLLRDKVERVLNRQGLPGDRHRYTPHITLGRVTGEQDGAAIHGFITANALLRLPPFTVESFSLVRSYLTKAGSIYEDIAEYPLN